MSAAVEGERSGRPPRPPGPRRSALVAWCLYDWANSAFPAVILTFVFATYFTQAVARTPVEGTAQWGIALTLSAFAIALISPVIGAIADQGTLDHPNRLAKGIRHTIVNGVPAFLDGNFTETRNGQVLRRAA